jgi:hypothetical protein
VKEFHENFSELVVLPSIDHDVDTGVEDQEEVGEDGEDGAPDDENNQESLLNLGVKMDLH